MSKAPLPERLRPKSFDEMIGQSHLVGHGARMRQLLEADEYSALILWGPPGTGKTTLARIIASQSHRPFVELSAVSSGAKEIRAAIAQSRQDLLEQENASLLFIDEIHRLNKGQQDVLLPALESGQIKFIGATTENPSFEVNKAMLSRCLVLRFDRFDSNHLVDLLRRSIQKSTEQNIAIDDEVLCTIAHSSEGDARRALNLLQAIIGSAVSGGLSRLTLDDLKALNLDNLNVYDKSGEQHYDVISAFIKSIRGSHPDAAIHYLARMLDAGEDPMFIARRIVISASEDIGNANPTALLIATSAMQAVHLIGMPEARIMLAQATTYLACSPKSNKSYEAINSALADVKALGSMEVPLHLRNAVTNLMKTFGYGKNYAYAHDEPQKSRQQSYLPQELRGKKYYQPSNIGAEAQLRANLEKLRPQVD